MIEERAWKVESEGMLVRDWEQRIRPKVQKRVRRRIHMPWANVVLWLGGIWVGAIVASALAMHVLTMSYHYDQMNQQYASLTRENQSLVSQVASLTSTEALQTDAGRLKVPLLVPDVSAPSSVTSTNDARVKMPTMMDVVTAWIQHLSQTLGR